MPNKAPYQDPSLSVEKRVADLLARMTLEEKVAQMVCVWQGKSQTLVDEKGAFDLEKARAQFKHGHGLGQVGRPSDAGGGRNAREQAELTNAIQKFFIENSRLGIPVIFHEECLHGQAAIGGTSFSQPIGLGATFNPDLVRRLFEMTAEEARVRGTHQALTPVVDVAREPRWGRVEETYGEDPYLVSRLGIAAVQGFQGDGTFKNKKSVIATLKHFAAHGQPESGTNCAPVNVSERLLREVFLYPFEQAIQKGGAMSVMASYNEIDGVPSHANRWLLRKVLREEWGFKGFVVSDYYAIRELNERPDFFGHHLAINGKEAALLAVRAGVNIELPEPDCYKHLVELVREGRLDEAILDELVESLLTYKFKLGLFDDPYVDPEAAARIVGSEANARLALQAARETITLLKNDQGTAPLDPKKIKTLAVIGPNADRELLGGYSGKPKQVSTVLSGIRERAGNALKVLYHEGCKITIGGSWQQDEVLFGAAHPGGKLPITIPRSAGHVPAYYNYKPSARRGYLFESVAPLFAFGYGLSYTQFKFGKPRLGKSLIRADGATQVSVEVTNIGRVSGDEVVQMYIRDRVSSVTRPVKELKGFQRLTLAPGEAKTVTLEITPEHLAFYDIDMNYVVEPGEFEIMVGNSSRDQDLQKVLLTVEE